MKITPEIEAVSRAICDLLVSADPRARAYDALFEDEKHQAQAIAIAAIRALREPTSRQIVAGLHEDLGPYDVATSYTAMIDAALGENK